MRVRQSRSASRNGGRPDGTAERPPALGTELSFDDFCRHEHQRLMGMLGLYCGDRDLAEELTQEALTRLCRVWSRFTTDDDAEKWVTRVAFNLAKSAFRSRVARRRVLDRHAHSLARKPSDDDRASVVAVRAAVAQLPDRQRRALVLRYFADLPVSAVAEVMGCPEGTVKTLTFEAISRLRRAGLEVTDA